MIFVLSENPTSFFLDYASYASCFSKSSIMNRQNSRTEKRMAQPVIHQVLVAINEEIASYEELDGINIMTDAIHGWRKNSKHISCCSGRNKRTKLWIVFMSLRLEILVHKDMKGLEQRQSKNIWQKKMCQLKFMHMAIHVLHQSLYLSHPIPHMKLSLH
jgi:hypothetical protein